MRETLIKMAVAAVLSALAIVIEVLSNFQGK